MYWIEDNQALIDALPDGSAVLDPQATIVAVNGVWRRFAEDNGGDARTHYVGADYIAVCERAAGESSAGASDVGRGLERVLGTGEEFRCEYPCHSHAELRWFELVARPLDLRGARHALVLHRNVTVRRLQQQAIRDSVEITNQLSAIVACSSDPIVSFDLEGTILTWNSAAEELYGYAPDEIIGRSMETLYPDGWPTRITDYIDRIVSGELTHFDVVRRTRDGRLLDIAVSAAPIRNADGDVTSISNIHRDVTEKKKLEERQKFVTRELSHRVKNMLAVVSAIERQTARRSATVEEFSQSFGARLRALTRTIDLLVASDWDSVSLEDLARRHLEAFVDLGSQSVAIGGPPVLLAPTAVHTLGMALHELATNAAKHGALRQPGGSISLAWRPAPGDGHAALNIAWWEQGPRDAPEDGSRGFGHEVLTAHCRHTLDAPTHYDLSPGAVRWSIDLPARFYSADGWHGGTPV